MQRYGITYLGSKNIIAKRLIERLPTGNRFVDLFGGGFAMSHCALLSGKYEQVLYNEFNPLLVDLIKRAINGDFNPDKFKPEWISREKFNELKDKDGYIKYIWSFGGVGKNYIYGADAEPLKKQMHEFVFTCKDIEGIPQIPDTDTKTRRLHIKSISQKQQKEFIRPYYSGDIDKLKVKKIEAVIRKYKSYLNPESLERLVNLKRLVNLENLQNLERLQNLENLKNLEITNDTYLNYKHRSGDVVYCDPPYENTTGYGAEFNHLQFYNWVNSREYPVYFSSYPIEDGRFTIIAQIPKKQTLSPTNNCKVMLENLYANKAALQLKIIELKPKQLELKFYA